MPPNLTIRPPRTGPALFRARHCSDLDNHAGVRFIEHSFAAQEKFRVQNRETGVDSFVVPFFTSGLKPVTFGRRSAPHGTQSSLCNETNPDQSGGIAPRGGGTSDNAAVSGAVASFGGRAGSDRGAAIGTRPPLTDTLLALVLLNVVACGVWALAAFPLLRTIAWGSVTALPWWLWAGFAVLMGALAGGHLR